MKSPIADILKSITNKKPEVTDVDVEDPNEDKKVVAQELLDAIKADDVDGIVSAFKSLVSLCSFDKYDDSEDEE